MRAVPESRLRITNVGEDLKNPKTEAETCARQSCGKEGHIAEQCPERIYANCKA